MSLTYNNILIRINEKRVRIRTVPITELFLLVDSGLWEFLTTKHDIIMPFMDRVRDEPWEKPYMARLLGMNVIRVNNTLDAGFLVTTPENHDKILSECGGYKPLTEPEHLEITKSENDYVKKELA